MPPIAPPAPLAPAGPVAPAAAVAAAAEIAAVAAAAVRCEALTDLAAIERLAPRWEALLARSRCNRAFSSPWWYLASCRARAGSLPYLVAAYRGRELAGLLPLGVVEASRTAEFATLLCDYNDVVTDAADAAVAPALLAFACRAPQPFEKLVLRRLRPDSACLRALAGGAGRPAGGHLFDGRVCPYARLPASGAAYLATRGVKLRKGLRNAASRAARQGAAVRELAPAELPGGALADAFLRLHGERFGGRSCFRAAGHRQLAAEVLPRLFDDGRLKVFAVLRGSALLGIDLCPVGPDSLCVWNGGYNLEAASWSAGKLLIAAEIDCACRLGLAELDLLIGTESYKLGWATHLRGLADLELAVRG
jgi:CelD/BcsL family acetyltransferase involved in cellulose biosynthesis